VKFERSKRKTFKFIEEGQLVKQEQRLVKKIQEKGDGFVATEIARLTKMTGSADITAQKKEFFQKRLNILPSFKASQKTEL